MIDATVTGKIRRGRQNTRWKDSCKRNMKNVGLKMDDIIIIGQNQVEVMNQKQFRRPQIAREEERTKTILSIRPTVSIDWDCGIMRKVSTYI